MTIAGQPRIAKSEETRAGTPGRNTVARTTSERYRVYMSKVDVNFDEPVPQTEEEDEETLAAINRGIQDADQGRTVSLDEAREMIPKWISKFASVRAAGLNVGVRDSFIGAPTRH